MPAPGEVSEAYGDTGARPLSSDHGRPFASRVRTVAVPYPQRTAGRDARWSFDRADREGGNAAPARAGRRAHRAVTVTAGRALIRRRHSVRAT